MLEKAWNWQVLLSRSYAIERRFPFFDKCKRSFRKCGQNERFEPNLHMRYREVGEILVITWPQSFITNKWFIYRKIENLLRFQIARPAFYSSTFKNLRSFNVLYVKLAVITYIGIIQNSIKDNENLFGDQIVPENTIRCLSLEMYFK